MKPASNEDACSLSDSRDETMEHTDPAYPSSDDAICSRVREVNAEAMTRTSGEIGHEERGRMSISQIQYDPE